MKSRIRSRWHRPNEKPLENDSSPAPKAPVGEINPSNISTLSDDLSNYSPRSRTEGESVASPRKGENGFQRREGRGDDRQNRRKNRRPARRNEQKSRNFDGDSRPDDRNESNGTEEQKNRRSPKRKGRSGNPSRSPRKTSENMGNSKKNKRSKDKPSERKTDKPSGLKGFLGKIFGG